MTGTPTVFFDGGDRQTGSSPPPYGRYRPILESHQADSSAVRVAVRALPGADPGAIRLEVVVEVAPGQTIPNPGTLRVRALLYENGVQTGQGTFDHVARAFVIDEPLADASTGAVSVYESLFTPDALWDREDLRAAAWVQRGETGMILNAVSADVGIPVPVRESSWGAIKYGFR